MLAKLTSKNQITLPKSAVNAFEGAAYYDVEVRPEGLLLRPAKIHVASQTLKEARKGFKKKGFDEDTIVRAVRWARRSGKQ
jgi:hypothetical protein